MAGAVACVGLLQIGQAAPGSVLAVSAPPPLVQPVDADTYYWRHHHRRYARDTHVHAPGTSVDVDRQTHVEAPFASVHVGRYGTWARAPFVDLFVPR
jgi:hypothetical protein